MSGVVEERGGRMLSVTGNVGIALVGVVLFCWSDARAGTQQDGQDEVELLFSPSMQTVMVGDEFEIGIIVRSVPEWDIPISALSVILNWEAAQLELLGLNDNGPYNWFSSGFPNDEAVDNLNEGLADPPVGVPNSDGDALYWAWSQFPPIPMAQATVSGLLVTSVMFRALEATELTEVSIPLTAGQWTETYVMSGSGGIVKDILVGTSGAAVEILPEPAALGLLAVGGLLMRRRGRCLLS